jgi:hypothetical protein
MAQGERSPALAALGLGLVGRRRAGGRWRYVCFGVAAGLVGAMNKERIGLYLFLVGWLFCLFVLPALLVRYIKPTGPLGLYIVMILPAALVSWLVGKFFASDAIKANKAAQEAYEGWGRAVDQLESLATHLDSLRDATNEIRAEIDAYQASEAKRNPRGRPAGVVSIPTQGGQASNKPITDPAVMAYLIQLQDAKARGELAQAIKANPWGSLEIPESTARHWLRRYASEITAARNSGNYSA